MHVLVAWEDHLLVRKFQVDAILHEEVILNEWPALLEFTVLADVRLVEEDLLDSTFVEATEEHHFILLGLESTHVEAR